MSYATLADMTERFGALELALRTDRTNGTTIDMAVLGRALADADAEIDSYLAARYALPLSSTPTVLVRLGADMARYRLYDDGVPETVRQRYADSVSLLKRMATGEVKLGGATEVPKAGGGANVVASITPKRLFGPAQLASY
jgi:phage gp36-like protein